MRPTTLSPAGCCASTACGSASSPAPACSPTPPATSSRRACSRRARGPFRASALAAGGSSATLALDGELAEHLVSTDAVRTHDRALVAEVAARLPTVARGTKDDRKTRSPRSAAARAGRRRDRCGPKRARPTLDFGDQMAARGARWPRGPAVAATAAGRVTGWCCSTSTRTRRSRSGAPAGLFGGGHPVTAVGDPCQAIYGWRGASVRNIDQFPQRLPPRRRPPGRPARAVGRDNRSDSATPRPANVLAAPLRAVHPASRRSRRAPPHRLGPGRTALHATHADELTWVADQVARLVHAGSRTRQHRDPVRAYREVAGLRDLLLGSRRPGRASPASAAC